jgi:RNA polymerase sigma factor (sigma-70 family)
MTASPLAKVVRGLRQATFRHSAPAAADAELLRRFLRSRDEAAFEALVHRHGAMVLGVCRRVLRNVHDAEDAFQATFLVLVRRAASVRPANMLGNWLYGVAQRTAMQARRNITRRRDKERAALPCPSATAEDSAELAATIDQELARLPDKLRGAVVLCDLEGRTRRDVARSLGLAEGTVASRLARGRVLLARRLRRRGVAPASGALAALVAREACAGVPAALVRATVQAATGKAAAAATVTLLTEGVLRTMLLTRLRNVLAVVIVATLTLTGLGMLPGTATVSSQSQATPAQPDSKPAPPARPTTVKIQVELEKIDPAERTLSAIALPPRPVRGELILDVGGKALKLQVDNLVVQRKRAKYTDLPIARDAKITDGEKELALADLGTGRTELELAASPLGLQVVAIRRLADKK